MELTKEKLLEIAERKEKCIKCDTEKHICIACDNFVCANKAWREEVAFYEQVRELLQANAEGRLMVLPCKQDDRVYMVQKGEVKEFIIGRVTVLRSGSVVLTLYGYQGGILAEEIGKTVFLTREEAEAVLKKMGGEKK